MSQLKELIRYQFNLFAFPNPKLELKLLVQLKQLILFTFPNLKQVLELLV